MNTELMRKICKKIMLLFCYSCVTLVTLLFFVNKNSNKSNIFFTPKCYTTIQCGIGFEPSVTRVTHNIAKSLIIILLLYTIYKTYLLVITQIYIFIRMACYFVTLYTFITIGLVLGLQL
jgi:hypothetical protein